MPRSRPRQPIQRSASRSTVARAFAPISARRSGASFGDHGRWPDHHEWRTRADFAVASCPAAPPAGIDMYL